MARTRVERTELLNKNYCKYYINATTTTWTLISHFFSPFKLARPLNYFYSFKLISNRTDADGGKTDRSIFQW